MHPSSKHMHAKLQPFIVRQCLGPAPLFSKFGGPISMYGAHICLFSPPSVRGSCMLKIRLEADFHRGTLKGLAAMGKYLRVFHENGTHLGGWWPVSSSVCTQRSVHCTLLLDIIPLHSSMWSKVLESNGFQGERFKYLTKICRKIGSSLGSWL